MTSSLSSATPSTPELRARLTMIEVIAKRCMQIRQAVMLRKHGYGGHRFYNIKRGGRLLDALYVKRDADDGHH